MSTRLKRLGSFLLAVAALFVFAQYPAQAEIIQIKNKVIDVNPTSNYLKVDQLDPATGEMEEIKINVERGTLFEVYTSLQDVKVGDDVSIEADFNTFNHEWKALSIRPYNQASAEKVVEAAVNG